MNKDDAEEYTQTVEQIAGATYRQILLAKKLGVPDALGMSTDQWVHKRLGGYVRYAIEERRRIAHELSEEGLKQREVAEVLGVAVATVNRDLGGDSSVVPNETESTAKTPDPVPNGTAQPKPELELELESEPEPEPAVSEHNAEPINGYALQLRRTFFRRYADAADALTFFASAENASERFLELAREYPQELTDYRRGRAIVDDIDSMLEGAKVLEAILITVRGQR